MKKITQFLTVIIMLLVTPNMTFAQLKKKRSRVGNLLNVNELERQQTIKRLKNGDRLDLDTRDEKGNSLLHLAAKSGSYTYGNMLIHLGLSFTEKNNEGKTPCAIAEEEKNDEMIELLKNYGNFFGYTYFGRLDKVKKALQKGAFVNTKLHNYSINGDKYPNGTTALHIAARLGYKSITRLLLTAGAHVNAQIDENNATPLHCACDFESDDDDTQSHENVVQQLLNAGAVVSIQDIRGVTPLHKATAKGYEGIVQKMLASTDANAAINVKTFVYNWTALHMAAKNGSVEIVQRLLAAGADKTIQDHHGRTALDIARANGHEDVVALLE